MWSHDIIGIQPDIVTIGKPMANGHSVGALITNYDFMSEFRKRYRYFNTLEAIQYPVLRHFRFRNNQRRKFIIEC